MQKLLHTRKERHTLLYSTPTVSTTVTFTLKQHIQLTRQQITDKKMNIIITIEKYAKKHHEI